MIIHQVTIVEGEFYSATFEAVELREQVRICELLDVQWRGDTRIYVILTTVPLDEQELHAKITVTQDDRDNLREVQHALANILNTDN